MSFTKQQDEFLYEWALIVDNRNNTGKLDEARLNKLNRNIKEYQFGKHDVVELEDEQ